MYKKSIYMINLYVVVLFDVLYLVIMCNLAWLLQPVPRLINTGMNKNMIHNPIPILMFDYCLGDEVVIELDILRID